MKRNDTRLDLPANVARKLRLIQRRARFLTLIEGAALTGAVLIVAMLIAMLIDLAVGWVEAGPRYTVTSLVLGGVAALAVLWCALPLLRRRTIASTAREVDQSAPQLEERWSTVTELSQSDDAPEVRGSATMIRRVASEADAASEAIDPETIVSGRPARHAVRWFVGATTVLLFILAVNIGHSRVLIQRFWMPGANVSLTELESMPEDSWVAKGEPLTLTAVVSGRVPKEEPKIILKRETAPRMIVAMNRRSADSSTFQFSNPEVTESFQYRVRAGDGQTPWHRITAVDRPEITAVMLTVTPPEYSKLEKEEKNSFPGAVRVLKGSDVTLALKSSQPLERMVLDLGNGKSTLLSPAEDNWYRFTSKPEESFTFAAIAMNQYKLENKNKPGSAITVYDDLAPSVKILAPSDDLAVLPTEKVNVTFEATDDFGLAKAELIVTTTTAEGKTTTQTLPVEMTREEGKKQLRKSVELDPHALGLKHGDQLSYVVQVTDTKQNPAQGNTNAPQLVRSSSPQAQTEANGEPKESEGAAPPDGSSLMAKAAPSVKESTPNNGSQRPPDEMSRRMLDAGQCAACKPRSIMIDEWAGTFEGEKRKKLEIAIAPVLELLSEHLQKAEEKTDLLHVSASSTQGLQAGHAEPLKGAKGHLGEVEKVVADLKGRTSGTPYAFIGLQLHNIAGAHVTPANGKLAQVIIAALPVANNSRNLESASFHIGRAREMLADLTRTFEQVKRDQKIADAMQKLAKMHQLFIEDTQALLGSSKGPINSYNRKIAEVDEPFVEKLKAMLEEKKKIMDELSKLLAEDPRLLRRFLAMQQMQCSSYRDQMTLLAERQKIAQQQLAAWNAATEAERGTLLKELIRSYAAGQAKVAKDGATLRENLETWLPLDVKPGHPQVVAALTLAEGTVKLITQSAGTDQAGDGERALDELRKLRSALSEFTRIESKEKPKMTAYIANRLAEIEALAAAQAAQTKVNTSLRDGNFAKAAEITQYAIAEETTTLSEKLAVTEKQVSRLSDEIANKAELLNRMVRSDILTPQAKSVTELSEKNTKAAGEILNSLVPAFAVAEDTFDEMMRLIIAKLDEAPAPSGGGGQPPQLDAILAMLQNEMKACENLGIPCRPVNVTVNSDWMKPGNGQGMSPGQAQAQAAQAQAQQAKADAEQIEKQAKESAQKALANAKKPLPENTDKVAERPGNHVPGWNKLASKLKKDLLQGRDSTPPEQYRAAIESYFRALTELPTPAAE